MQKPNTCCDKWWNRLSNTQKEWIHYYFYDIEDRGIVEQLTISEIHKMHESRFELEGYHR